VRVKVPRSLSDCAFISSPSVSASSEYPLRSSHLFYCWSTSLPSFPNPSPFACLPRLHLLHVNDTEEHRNLRPCLMAYVSAFLCDGKESNGACCIPPKALTGNRGTIMARLPNTICGTVDRPAGCKVVRRRYLAGTHSLACVATTPSLGLRRVVAGDVNAAVCATNRL